MGISFFSGSSWLESSAALQGIIAKHCYMPLDLCNTLGKIIFSARAMHIIRVSFKSCHAGD
jgi:hypothetical protein